MGSCSVFKLWDNDCAYKYWGEYYLQEYYVKYLIEREQLKVLSYRRKASPFSRIHENKLLCVTDEILT